MTKNPFSGWRAGPAGSIPRRPARFAGDAGDGRSEPARIARVMPAARDASKSTLVRDFGYLGETLGRWFRGRLRRFVAHGCSRERRLLRVLSGLCPAVPIGG